MKSSSVKDIKPLTGFSGNEGEPFFLQGSEVLFEGGADLAQQLHQRMAQKTGVGWLRVEGVGSRSERKNNTYKHVLKLY